MLTVQKLSPRRKLKKLPPRPLPKLRLKPLLKSRLLLKKLPLLKRHLLLKRHPPLKKLPQKLSMRVLKSYGTEGGVIISAASFPGDFDISEPVFIDFDGLPVPFFIEEFKPHGSSKAFVKLEDIDSLKDAEELVGRDVYLRSDNEQGGADFSGLQVFDAKSAKPVGKVKEYIDIPSNPCLEVQLPDSEDTVLIPCHDELIDRVDEKKGRIYIKIPEGLV